jgi:hypothetical protein
VIYGVKGSEAKRASGEEMIEGRGQRKAVGASE